MLSKDDEQNLIIVKVTIEEAFLGCHRTITLQCKELCQLCHGAGCSKCGENGYSLELRKVELIIPPQTKEGSILLNVNKSEILRFKIIYWY